MDDAAKARIRKSLDDIIRSSQQSIIDVEWWNTNRTDAAPMDCELERLMLGKARACLGALEADDMELLSTKTNELHVHAGVITKELDEGSR